MLILPIKKKWFDMIKAGIKLEEYREIKPYYTSRFRKNSGLMKQTKMSNEEFLKDFKELRDETLKYNRSLILRNGYKKDSPKLKIDYSLRIGQGKEEWGAEKRKRVFCFRDNRKG